VAAGGDAGDPVSLAGTGAAADEFRRIAAQILSEIAPPTPPADIDLAGCTAHEYEAVTPVTLNR
jgi:ATP-binding protein involved in chromosome partitioning